jgi:hypothetical protein
VDNTNAPSKNSANRQTTIGDRPHSIDVACFFCVFANLNFDCSVWKTAFTKNLRTLFVVPCKFYFVCALLIQLNRSIGFLDFSDFCASASRLSQFITKPASVYCSVQSNATMP